MRLFRARMRENSVALSDDTKKAASMPTLPEDADPRSSIIFEDDDGSSSVGSGATLPKSRFQRRAQMSSIDRNLDALGLAPHPDAHEELPRYELETIQMFGSLTGASLTWLELKQLGFKLDPQWKSTSQSMLESTVSSAFLVKLLEGSGLQRGDARLTDFYGKLRDLDALEVDRPLTLAVFDKLVAPCRDIIYLAISGDLSIPDFSAFGSTLEKIYSKINEIKSGANASYIPQLAQVNPEQFGISVTTVSGQHLSIGDSDVPFCIQSCSKPLSYLMALGEHGSAYVHRCVGTEPSGQRFNEMVLKDAPEPKQPSRRIPHNPMINAGAMMMCSMLSPKLTREERLEKVLDTWRALTAGAGPDPVGYDDATYQSESATADRNWCLAYMMKESGAFPPCFTSLSETLELYFQICSVLCTSRGMSVMAATLANGGLNPITGERVFAADDVRRVLPLMLTCGMYDFSGQWAFDVGLPAKSGVGGCVFMVIPNVCGIAVWSPRLDPVGNSVRAVAVAQELCRTYALHNFEVFSGLSRHKVDLSKRRKNEESIKAIAAVLFAASHGDVRALRSHHIAGMDIYASDYDQRTALHIAAAAGNVDAVEYLVKTAPAADLEHIVEAKDRWGFTPLHEAENFDRSVIDKNGQAQRRSRISIDDDAAERHGALSLPPHAPLASPLCTPSLGAPQP